MNEKNLLVIMIALVSVAFVLTMFLMLRWSKTRTELCEKIYRKSDRFVKAKKYKYLLLGAYLFPMLTPHHHVWLRFCLMSLFFLLIFPLGIKLIVGRVKVKPSADDPPTVNLTKDRGSVEGAANDD